MRSLKFLLSLSLTRRILPLLAIGCLLLTPQPARCAKDASTHDMSGMHEGMSMPMGGAVDGVTQAELLAYKRESEFNHHLAGLLVLIAGLLILADGSIRQPWAFARHVWPVCFLASGIFLLVFSDTELWPFNSQSWYFGLTHHMEVLQHKIFAVLLLGLGVIELQRTRGTLTGKWSSWVFPLVAATGSLMLLFHEHQAGMTGPNHMELMHRIQSEHLSFAVTGFGIALSKGLAETSFDWRPFFQHLFPTLLIVLGALLLVYVE
jgi:putative copper resistance protein D